MKKDYLPIDPTWMQKTGGRSPQLSRRNAESEECKMNTYKLHEQPKPVGCWVLYAEAAHQTSFIMYHKPSWLQRWFTNKLLNWAWRDAE